MTDSELRRQVAARVRKLRRHVPLPIHTKLTKDYSLRRLALHEAAHAVVVLACEGEVLLAHLGNKFGTTPLNYGTSNSGIVGALFKLADLGKVSLAGMVQDRVLSVSPLDAEAVYSWLVLELGPWPCRELVAAKLLVEKAICDIEFILQQHTKAVVAVADLLEAKLSVLDGAIIRRVAITASPTLPALACSEFATAAKDYRKALSKSKIATPVNRPLPAAVKHMLEQAIIQQEINKTHDN